MVVYFFKSVVTGLNKYESGDSGLIKDLFP